MTGDVQGLQEFLLRILSQTVKACFRITKLAVVDGTVSLVVTVVANVSLVAVGFVQNHLNFRPVIRNE